MIKTITASLRIEPRYYHKDYIYNLAVYEDLEGVVVLAFDTDASLAYRRGYTGAPSVLIEPHGATCRVQTKDGEVALPADQADALIAHFATEIKDAAFERLSYLADQRSAMQEDRNRD